MEIQQLEESVNHLQRAITEFPIGANTPDDFKPIEEKILDVRESLKAINARRLILKVIIDSGNSPDLPQGNLTKTFEKVNETVTNYLINSRTLKLCHQSQAIQDILYKNKGAVEIQEKVKLCLNKLFIFNDKILASNEKKRQLMLKQYQLRLECQHVIYDHQDFLKEKEARENQLQENNENIIHYKEKINRTLVKINTMKKLVTDLIAANCYQLKNNEELVEMLSKHKDIVTLETIVELAQNQSSSKSSN